jgi:hypothetical protein
LPLRGTSQGAGSPGSPGRQTFYTVQSTTDAARLRSGGTPWPKEANRAALGEGVYSWSNRADAENYLQMIQKNNPSAKILEFSVSNKALEKFKSINIDALSDSNAEKFMRKFSRLWGGTPNHGYEYIQRGTNIGREHFFSKSVFNHLLFK